MVIEIKDDLLNTDCKIIAHGVNCQGVMGSGVAKALFTKWPRVKNFYHDFFLEFNAGPDGENFLGSVDDILVEKDKIVVNCFTQQFYGYDNNLYLSYDALKKCMKELLNICNFNKVNEVAIPKIGCGLAGGDWIKVKSIIEEVFPKDFKVKVYYL